MTYFIGIDIASRGNVVVCLDGNIRADGRKFLTADTACGGSHGHVASGSADITIEEMDLTDMDMIVLPGGLGGVASIRGCQAAMDAIAFAHENRRFVAAICAGPTVLADLGITDGKNATCYPGCDSQMGSANMVCSAAVTDGKLITGTSAGCAIPFGLALIAALKGRSEAERIAEQIVIR